MEKVGILSKKVENDRDDWEIVYHTCCHQGEQRKM